MADGEAPEVEAPDVPEVEKSKDLWQIIVNSAASSSQKQQDVNVVVLGNKQVGKSTIISKIRSREDTSVPKPTAALEYSHMRREDRGQVKVAHFWELGGGQQLSSLLDVAITEHNIHTCLVVLVVDLKEGRAAWTSLQHRMISLRDRIKECFRRLKLKSGKNQQTISSMLVRMQKRFGEKHPDFEKVKIYGVPVVIVGTKYDLFKEESSETLKVMSRTLRFWAHYYASALVYVSTKDERDTAKFRQLMMHLIFGVPWSGQPEFDHNKPLLILPGKDSFKDIGPAMQAQRPQNFVSSGSEEFDKWKAAFEAIFPAVKEKDVREIAAHDILSAEVRGPDEGTLTDGHVIHFFHSLLHVLLSQSTHPLRSLLSSHASTPNLQSIPCARLRVTNLRNTACVARSFWRRRSVRRLASLLPSRVRSNPREPRTPLRRYLGLIVSANVM